nr:hypothetical protein [Micromonospora sp. DSM 115978]
MGPGLPGPTVPVPLRGRRADVPEALERLVLDLTAKSSEQRPADAFGVYERLLPYLPSPGAPPDHAEAREIGDILTRIRLARRDGSESRGGQG